MPIFIGKSINLNFQEAFEDAVRHAMLEKAEGEHALVTEIEVRRIFSTRTDRTGFHTLEVEIEAS